MSWFTNRWFNFDTFYNAVTLDNVVKNLTLLQFYFVTLGKEFDDNLIHQMFSQQNGIL